MAILDADQTIRKIGLRGPVIGNRGPDCRLVFNDELLGGEQPVQYVNEGGFGETVTVAQHPDALTENDVVEKQRLIPIFCSNETTLHTARLIRIVLHEQAHMVAVNSVVSVRHDEETGNVILAPRQKRSWAQFFKRLKRFQASGEIPADFLGASRQAHASLDSLSTPPYSL